MVSFLYQKVFISTFIIEIIYRKFTENFLNHVNLIKENAVINEILISKFLSLNDEEMSTQ